MKLELTETLWLDERGAVTLIELAQCSGLSEAELRELVDMGAIEPLDPDAGQWSFGSHCIVAARAASRLRKDFELDTSGLAVVLSLLERVHELESEVQHMHARLPRMLR
ncbi:MAG: merR regulatory family protein [Betaproteobacteria bacterium]|nr:merR regulatory family protein [Betaproteobacteria bacterium]